MHVLPSTSVVAGFAICAMLLFGASASAQQFSPADEGVMKRICEPPVADHDLPPEQIVPQGLPCVYDINKKIVGLTSGTGYLVRRMGGNWYLMLYQNIGLSSGSNFFFISPNCTGASYLETGDGQISGAILVEQLPFVAQVAGNNIYGAVGTPIQIKLGSIGNSPTSASQCSSYSGGGPTVTVRPAVAIDQTTFSAPFSIR